MTPGESLSLADPANVELCRLGWSGMEAAGRWTDGPVAVLGMRATGPAAGVTLSLHAFIGPEPRTLKLRLLLAGSGEVLADQEVSFDNETPRELRLAASLPPGPVMLKLVLDCPRSPEGHGISADDRALGVQLSRVTLRA